MENITIAWILLTLPVSFFTFLLLKEYVINYNGPEEEKQSSYLFIGSLIILFWWAIYFLTF